MTLKSKNAILAGVLATGMVSLTGCVGTYSDIVDPCYQDRYNCMARETVIVPQTTMAENGTALEQTVYNYHFREGSDELLPGGKSLLIRLARRRPQPDTRIYVQATNDESVLGNRNLEEIGAKRKELNEKRVAAVAEFLKAIRPDVGFTIAVHDPSKIGIFSEEARSAISDMHSSATGNMQLQGPGGVAAGGGGGGEQGGGGQGGGGGGAPR